MRRQDQGREVGGGVRWVTREEYKKLYPEKFNYPEGSISKMLDEMDELCSKISGIQTFYRLPPPDPIWLMYQDHGQGD